ncbi:hypothetical protein PLICRDRAFT_430623 [Plicaturopsis crispa FD-325 SS-3]|uniref:F-box domain-containing protein n=1 Tax=Plicaturopsis crispa FD-325 SS-3 TaxID=944288 RepID=A0A0C9SKK4_PLICR|nr:hypothetical protein PLICRDRAFT_430623 [Plicaturopsis crispa FD-325 SS-3]
MNRPRRKCNITKKEAVVTVAASPAHSEEDDDGDEYEYVDQPEMSSKKRKTRRKSNAKKPKALRGKLAAFKDMPLDIFYEIMLNLSPLDILHLTRLSKPLRLLLTRKSARHIWAAARRNVWLAARRNVPHPALLPLPECPGDMSEMGYAALLFERNCHMCESTRAQKVDYALRMRFCSRCLVAQYALISRRIGLWIG